jgi:hypothetical protein
LAKRKGGDVDKLLNEAFSEDGIDLDNGTKVGVDVVSHNTLKLYFENEGVTDTVTFTGKYIEGYLENIGFTDFNIRLDDALRSDVFPSVPFARTKDNLVPRGVVEAFDGEEFFVFGLQNGANVAQEVKLTNYSTKTSEYFDVPANTELFVTTPYVVGTHIAHFSETDSMKTKFPNMREFSDSRIVSNDETDTIEFNDFQTGAEGLADTLLV